MATQNDTIELNGYRYDARTGQRLGRVSETPSGQPPQKSIDGFGVRRSMDIAPKKNIAPKVPAPSHSVHKRNAKSQTLMRKGLQKPTPKPQQPAHSPIGTRSLQPNHARISRAEQAQKSPHVAKFQATTSDKPMGVQPAPEETTPAKAQTQEPQRTVLPLSPFDMALQKASIHEQRAPSKPSIKERLSRKLSGSPRALSIGLGAFLVLSIGIFFARQHMSTLAVQLAATRAGVEAQLPGYEPAGFSLSGPIEYSAGQIALSYQSNSDERNFKITQKNSDWNSQTLLENFIQASDTRQFQTVQDNGKTIYIYDGNNATWVSGGIWYQVEGESSLNTDQLLRIASGL